MCCATLQKRLASEWSVVFLVAWAGVSVGAAGHRAAEGGAGGRGGSVLGDP